MSLLAEHYEAVRRRHGYGEVDFDLGGLPARHLRRTFAAVDGRDAVAAAPERETVIATGVGMTGPPHMGTLGQILTAIELQGSGLDVQFVLADLEVYHGGGDPEALRGLAERYRSFVLDLGFDPDGGTLRTQEEARDVMHTAQLLARYYTPDEGGYWPDTEPTAWTEAVSAAYEEAETDEDGPTSDAAGVHSSVLHRADFVHPLMKEGYEQVIITLGIDEHALTVGTRRFLEDAPVEGTIAGLHTRLVEGVDGHPKMSKSIPGSDVHLGMSPGEIRDRIRHPNDDYDHPSESTVFGMMCLASAYGPEELDRRFEACAAGGAEWAEAKREYAEYVVDVAESW